MVKELVIDLENGKKETLVFTNYFLRLYARLMSKDGKVKSVEETLTSILDIVKGFQEVQGKGEGSSYEAFRGIDNICIALIPVVCASMNAYRELNDLDEDADMKAAEKLLNRAGFDAIGSILNALIQGVIPQGLPADKKKAEPVKKAGSRSKK